MRPSKTVRAFLSMRWSGNEHLRAWFRQNLISLGIDVIEGGEPATSRVSADVAQRIADCDLFVVVLTEGGESSFVNQEIGIAFQLKKPLLVFCEGDEGDAALTRLKGIERNEVVCCSFRRSNLTEDGYRIVRFVREAQQKQEREKYRRDVGFVVQDSFTDIRFHNWTEKTHAETYEKSLRIRPLRNGKLSVRIKSGSSDSDWRSRHHGSIDGTHRFEEFDLHDGYHILTEVTIEDAMEERLEEIVEKTVRPEVPNRSEDCIHPEYAHYSADLYWCIVFHVLYPTEILRFRAQFSDGHEIAPDSIKVLHHAYGRQTEDLDANARMVNEGGALQYLRWERPDPQPDTDYLIIWQWQEPIVPTGQLGR